MDFDKTDPVLNRKLFEICSKTEDCKRCPLKGFWSCDGVERPQNYDLLFKIANTCLDNLAEAC